MNKLKLIKESWYEMNAIIGNIKPEWIDLAYKIGNARRQHHIKAGTYNGLPSKINDVRNESFGVLGEIIFEEELKNRFIAFTSAPSFTHTTSALPSYDFKLLSGTTLEVKTTPIGERYVRFMVNEKSFKNQDMYVAIKIVDRNTYRIEGWATGKQVSFMQRRDWGEGMAYWEYLDRLSINQPDDVFEILLGEGRILGVK